MLPNICTKLLCWYLVRTYPLGNDRSLSTILCFTDLVTLIVFVFISVHIHDERYAITGAGMDFTETSTVIGVGSGNTVVSAFTMSSLLVLRIKLQTLLGAEC